MKTYRKSGDVWVSRGRDPIGGFTEFAAGVIEPSGFYDPEPTNVGPRPGVPLEYHPGDYVLTSGAIVSGVEVEGSFVSNGALTSPAHVSDFICHGNPASSIAPAPALAIGKSYNLGGTVFEWGRFDGTGKESPIMDGVSGGNFTVRYSEIGRVVDGAHLTQSNVTLHCVRIYKGHYFAFWDDAAGAPRTTAFTDFGGKLHSPPFPAQSSGDTHSDGIQLAGGSNYVVRGCSVGGGRGSATSASANLDPTVPADYTEMMAYDTAMGYRNASIIINALQSNPVGALIENNWFYGGQARVNISTNGTDLAAGVTVRNNKFGRAGYGFYIYAQNGHQATLSNNVYADDGTAVPVVLW